MKKAAAVRPERSRETREAVQRYEQRRRKQHQWLWHRWEARVAPSGGVRRQQKAALQEARAADRAARRATRAADQGAGGSSVGVEAGAGPSVGRYTVFELDVPYSETGVTNVWDNVKVNAVFTSPSNKTITVHGFYLGTNDWKVRFAPSEIGALQLSRDRVGRSEPEDNRWIVQQRGVN